MLAAGAAGLVAGVAAASRLWVVRRSAPFVAGAAAELGTDQPRVAAVLGAGLRPDGSPTALLARRVEAGVALYQAGTVTRLIMSGAAEMGQDQPAAMARYAVAQGVPQHHIELDRNGVNTAATCRGLIVRAGGRSVVLVTQEFHMSRAVYLGRKAGLDVVGFASPDTEVRPKALLKARLREIPAAAKAVFLDRF